MPVRATRDPSLAHQGTIKQQLVWWSPGRVATEPVLSGPNELATLSQPVASLPETEVAFIACGPGRHVLSGLVPKGEMGCARGPLAAARWALGRERVQNSSGFSCTRIPLRAYDFSPTRRGMTSRSLYPSGT